MAKYYDVDNETPFVKAEEDFYHYNQGSPYGKIPMERIEAKISALTVEKDYEEVLRVLSYWQEEAYALGDYYGERVIRTIASGYNILIGNYEKALSYAEKNLFYTVFFCRCGKSTINICTRIKIFFTLFYKP